MSIEGPLPPPIEPLPNSSPPSDPPVENLSLPLDTIQQIDSSLILSASNQAIKLTPGRFSLLELTTLIDKEVKKLRSQILRAENLEPELLRRYHMAAFLAAQELEELYSQLKQTSNNWQSLTTDGENIVNVQYPNLVDTYDAYNTSVSNTWQTDRTEIQDLNALYQDYNTLTPLRIQQIYDSLTPQERADLIAGMSQAEIDALGGEQNAVVIQWFNKQITEFNTYAAARDIQAQIDNLNLQTANYNAIIDAANQAITQVNIQREQYHLDPFPLYTAAPAPNPMPLYPTIPQQPLITTPIPPTAAEIKTPLTVPGPNDKGTVNNPPSPGTVPVIKAVDLIAGFFLPILTTSLAIIAVSVRVAELAAEWAQNDAVTTNSPGIKNFVAPYGLFQKVGDVPISDVSGGGGVGLNSFSIGLHSRVLERVLSHGLFQTVAEQTSMPVSEQFLQSLQFSSLELLSKSSLLSAEPTIRSLSARLGNIGSDSPVIAAAIALTFGDQVAALTNSNVVRELVNGQISGLSFYARNQQQEALAGATQGEAALQEALTNGDPTLIDGAVNYLAKTRTALAETTRLSNAFGGASIGELAQTANGLSASLNLSLLSVSTALYARALGIPELAPALFAQTNGVPTTTALAAMGSGSSIISILDNPINMVYIKQALVERLASSGVDASKAQAMISGAINGTILKGNDITTLGGLKEVLLSEFLGNGAGLLQANTLANEVVALIQGDLGNLFLHTSFGLNADSSLIASSIANDLFSTDIGLAGSMLSNAIVGSLLYGGFGSQVLLQNELSTSDAYAVANQTREFIEMLGVTLPLSQYPGLAELLVGSPFLSKIARGEGIVRQELLEDLQVRGLSNTQAEFLADQLDALAKGEFSAPSQNELLKTAIKEAIDRALIQQDAFETQRDFRDRLADELRSAGFARQEALYLSNKAAVYGTEEETASVYGVSAARIAAMDDSLAERIATDTKLSRGKADAIVEEARQRTAEKAPYASEDAYKNILREEVYNSLLKEGVENGQVIFDNAMASLVDASKISLESLRNEIEARALAIFTPELGSKLAEEIKNKILSSLLGGTTIEKIQNAETRDPLSVLNQIDTQVKHLVKEEEAEHTLDMTKKLKQLLEALLTPNAQLGFVLTSLTDNPGTFFNAANASLGSDNFQATQIVV